jgi:UDP:flavonoid glycosyltransferase YjiC (YdhE family)
VRILVTTNPAHGHFLPMPPLMNAARSAGHDVVVATGSDLAREVGRHRFPVWAVGPTWPP